MKMRIKKLKISGFRGFAAERPVDLSQPVTILYGENAKGKSSVLNAIEWCLFGSECAGKDTRMRERVGWRPENRLGSVPCRVTMICQNPDGDITFERVPRPRNKGLTISRKGQIVCSDAEANTWVAENIGNFTQFMAMVYQHQENIRHLAIAEDSVKRNIINRLLGLSDYSNLLDSLQSTGYSTFSRKVTGVRDDIDDIIEDRIFGYKEQNKVLSQALKLRPNAISRKLIETEADKLTSSVQSLYSKTGVKLGTKTRLADHGDPHKYINHIRDTGRALQTKSPQSQENLRVGREISDLDYHIAKIDASARKRGEEHKNIKEFEVKHGKLGSLQRKLNRLEEKKTSKEDEIARLDAVYSVLSGLYNYLVENQLGIGKQMCLACGSIANNQQDFLKHRVKELKSDKIKAAHEELEGICDNIRLVSEDVRKLKELEERLELAEKAFKDHLKETRARLRLTMKPSEDPMKILKKRKIESEQRRDALQKALKDLLSNISKIEESCDRLDKIVAVMDNKEEIERLSSIKQHKAYKELMKLEGEADLLSSDIKAIVAAITLVRDKESGARVARSKKKVSEYFNMVAENPAIKDLEMIVEHSRGYENFRFKDASDEDVITILSQGDLNVLALSIFAGLGEANLKDIPFQSIIFDDPSQSMGLHHKQRLAELANIIAENRQVIISTMDSEFRHLLEKHITRPVKVIEFEHWNPTTGPELK